MSPSWRIACLDLRRMVKDRTFFFWSLAFPMMFILLFGNLYKDSGQRPSAELVVVNQDQGPWGAALAGALHGPELVVHSRPALPEQYTRALLIPADFSARIESRTAQKLVLKKNPDASVQAAAQVETRLIQALVRLVAGMVLNPEAQSPADMAPLRELVTLRSGYPPGTLREIPSGFDHVIPGILVQMIMILVLIYGGITVMLDRQSGVLARIRFSPTSTGQLWTGKFLGRLMAGLVQALILVAIGLAFFHLNLGSPLLSLMVIGCFSAAIASLSIFFGSVFRKEQVIIGLAILFANLFAALGGCWWPIEVVPPLMRTIGMATPAWWAMDAFHKLIFFHKGLETIWLHLGVLLAYTVLFSLLAIRFFKIRD